MTDASFNIGGQLFRARGKVNVVTGWKLLFQKDHQNEQSEDTSDNDADMVLPPLNKGDNCIVNGAAVEDKKTSPPPPFTEGTLIAAMKNAASFVSDPKLKKCCVIMRDWEPKRPGPGYLRRFSPVITRRKRQTYPRHVAGRGTDNGVARNADQPRYDRAVGTGAG